MGGYNTVNVDDKQVHIEAHNNLLAVYASPWNTLSNGFLFGGPGASQPHHLQLFGGCLQPFEPLLAVGLPADWRDAERGRTARPLAFYSHVNRGYAKVVWKTSTNSKSFPVNGSRMAHSIRRVCDTRWAMLAPGPGYVQHSHGGTSEGQPLPGSAAELFGKHWKGRCLHLLYLGD